MDLYNTRLMWLAWMKTHYPVVYAEALRRTLNPAAAPASEMQLSGLGDWASFTDSFNSLLQNVSNVATTYLTSKAQVQQVTSNVQRINAGLPPLNANGTVMTAEDMQAAGYSAATISQVEANLARSNPLRALTSGSTGTLLLLGGLGLGAFLLLRRR